MIVLMVLDQFVLCTYGCHNPIVWKGMCVCVEGVSGCSPGPADADPWLASMNTGRSIKAPQCRLCERQLKQNKQLATEGEITSRAAGFIRAAI